MSRRIGGTSDNWLSTRSQAEAIHRRYNQPAIDRTGSGHQRAASLFEATMAETGRLDRGLTGAGEPVWKMITHETAEV